jgi:very-short-patch-repair endonuclease
MRHDPTESEARLFQVLRGGRLGVTFRRQVPLLGRFIVDLYASEVKLIVEIDGGYHAEREAKDAHRERALERAGYTVVRLDAELVMRDVEAAVARLAAAIEELRGEAPR